MIPRCGSCKYFCDEFPQGIETMFTVLYNMELQVFDGYCKEFLYRFVMNPFFFSLRKRNYTCGLWKWRGQKKNESDIDQATVGK